jgi:hypothetical protein
VKPTTRAAIGGFLVGFVGFEFVAAATASSSSSCDDLCGFYFLELAPLGLLAGFWCALLAAGIAWAWRRSQDW